MKLKYLTIEAEIDVLGGLLEAERQDQLQMIVCLMRCYQSCCRLGIIYCYYKPDFFLSQETEKVGSSPIFEEVIQSLNDVGRETALFNCLEVSNDYIELAVVECLNNVPLSELDNGEIATAIRLLGSFKIYRGKNFRLKYGEQAKSEAIGILIRNLMRVVEDPDEEMEILSLLKSCVYFLKFNSISSDIKKFIASSHDEFKQALYANEQYLQKSKQLGLKEMRCAHLCCNGC
ncbi:UNKNOWN [Stylonychia lemnae]|uniref:Uncharacterized protein n=1 Tax=Stylonychia lemnae TaxID=5949 RepID=A0A078B922_STYLE|nr:UNKNOWN [Stylonychia lemnae]|eukprot:CDW89777.1 UNKNOWN [Stylonychia lemnae]